MSGTEEEIAEEMSPDEIEQAAEEDENGAQDRDGEQEGAQPEAAAAPRSQKEIDALTGKLEAEATRHTKRVAEIMGDDFSLLVPSPVDWTPGFIFAVPEMLPTQEQVAAFDAILGRAQGVEYLEAKDAEMCADCAGLGEVLTGSRKDGQITKPCTACTGTGWRTKAAPLQLAPQPNTAANVTYSITSEPNQFPVADRWGRPAGHPHYNMEPASVGA